MSDNLQPLSIKDLLSNNSRYSIPIYQRNYAWGQKEITQLIQDVVDYSLKYPNKDYYIGTLVVYEKESLEGVPVFETIDGQQRLTTLTILLSAIRNHATNLGLTHDLSWFSLNLSFYSREKSTKTLKRVYNDEPLEKGFSSEIKYAYDECLVILQRVLKEENLSIDDFCKYLFTRVRILRVPVPHDTDLNHYFEIMNSRGEQLEKHEVLKAKLLEFLTEEKECEVFDMIWEACANMEKYVQYGFSVKNRDMLFGEKDWNHLQVDSFDGLCEIIQTRNENDALSLHKLAVLDIIKGKKIEIHKAESEADSPDRFNSVINFSNFLLHVLRIHSGIDIPLDDKRLLDVFKDYMDTLDEGEDVNFVKDFCFALLSCKHLFDNYIIKREFLNGADNWSLKSLKWYKGNKVGYVNSFALNESDDNEHENKKVLMLLSMFHVSTPTLVYKHWLNAALKYVYETEFVTEEYLEYLEQLADAFLFDRFLAKDPRNYYEIIYLNDSILSDNEIVESKLDQGTHVENFIFNYLDYLLWRDGFQGKSVDDGSFKFSFRSSVEHYYPQRSMEGLAQLERDEVDQFGNLCLISSSVNSRLWNLPPDGKKSYFLESNSHESLKQKIMLEHQAWTLKEITEHGEMMKDILIER